ncbi:MAG: ankyrin repeat domain-containing protein [Candidatus Dependentiae bacterium]|nr:ankyrin repeat domain-containing protein [Candidatus Dependentiae bacterium]
MKRLTIALCVATGILGTNYTRAMDNEAYANTSLGVSASQSTIKSDAETLKSVIKDKNKSSEKKIDELTKLLEKIDVNTKDSCGQSAIIYACEMGDLAIVKFLIGKGANTKVGVDLMHLAALANSVELTEFFIDKLDWDINSVTCYQSTAICMLSREKYVLPVLAYLIEKGGNPNIGDLWGYTPLHHASLWGNGDIVKHLVENGADCLLKNQDQKTAADLAANQSIRSYLLFAELLAQVAGKQAVFDKEKNIWISPLFDDFAKTYLDAKNNEEEYTERIEDTKRILNNPRKNIFNQNKVLVEQFNLWEGKNLPLLPLESSHYSSKSVSYEQIGLPETKQRLPLFLSYES